MDAVTINSETQSLIKGVRLQKMRAAEILLDEYLAMKEGEISQLYIAIEASGDVLSIDHGDAKIRILEENKNYKSRFTINSEEIKKSLRIFYDAWRRALLSDKIRFVFYTNTNYAKEKYTKLLRSRSLLLPTKPVLQLLSEGKCNDVVKIVQSVFVEYYMEVYSRNNENSKALKKQVEKLTENDFVTFLNLIEWRFGGTNEKEIYKNLEVKIETICIRNNWIVPSYSNAVDILIEMIERHSQNENLLDKVINIVHIEKMLSKMVTEVTYRSGVDPVHSRWDSIDVSDRRDLRTKLMDVCPLYPADDIEQMIEDYFLGGYEASSYPDQKEVKSYFYRIYYQAQKALRTRVNSNPTKVFDVDEINQMIENAIDEAATHIEDKSKTYNYPFKDRDMVKNTFYMLLQECFICFE